MSDKFKPGDKVRIPGGDVNFYIGAHPFDGSLFWALCPPDPQPILRVMSKYELIPEPRKVEGWVLVEEDGRICTPPFKYRYSAWSHKHGAEKVIYVSGTEGVEP